MNMLLYYLKFISKSYHKMAKEILMNYYDEKILDTFINEYFNIRYYNYYDGLLSIEEKIDKYLNKCYLSLVNDNRDNEEMIINIYMAFNYLLLLDNKSYISNDVIVRIITDYRREIALLEDKIFPKRLEKLIESFKTNHRSILEYFLSDKFKVELTNTSKDFVRNVKLTQKIAFPKIYNKSVIEDTYNISPIREDKLLVEYFLVMPLILKDLNDFIFDKYYLVDFSVDLFENKEYFEKIKENINNDIFKFKAVFKVTFDDYSKYCNEIKEMIKEGYLFAILVSSSVDISNNILFNIFKYIIVDNKSIHKGLKDDKIVMIG